MNRILATFFLVTSVTLLSQEIDDEYLETLPDDVKESVISRIEEKDKTQQPTYRKASSSLDKNTDDIFKTDIFGSIFFDTIQSTFMPVNEPNLDSSYILDFGDVLEVQLIGQKNLIEKFYIDRDGSISFPEIGNIYLSGLTLKDASSLIKAKIKTAYIGTDAFVTLTNIRDINVLISGNAYNPGVYTLNGNSNALHALSMAGGIGEYGSYRNISIIRNGKVINNIDVYEIIINGTNSVNSGLRSGDTVHVNAIGKLISVESGVKRKFRYELKESETINDLIRFANGFASNADTDNILIKRVSKGVPETISVRYEDLSTFIPKDNDSLYIKEYKVNTVEVLGAVQYPGIYKIPVGSTLADIIITAGGYDKLAYPFGGYLENRRALEINTQSRKKLYDDFLNNISTSVSSISTDSLNTILSMIMEADVSGRVIAEFDLDVIKDNSNLDTVLENQDKIYIPFITNQVYVHGEVNNPGAIRYVPGEDFYFYINSKGGYLENADSENIFIIHPNGETVNLKSNPILSFTKDDDIKNLIYPGSVIYVPKKAKFRSGVEVASIWAPILSSIALSLTSLSVLNNQN